MREQRFVYVLKKYPFYEGSTILMISEDYDKVREYFDELEKKRGYGFYIAKYELGKRYTSIIDSGETIIHYKIDYDGEVCEWTGDDWVK